MASVLEKPKRARLSQPKVRRTEPDETLQRYHVDLFNPSTGKAKDASYEEINFDLYKPGAKSIAFTTTEARISLWIRCFIERYYKRFNMASNEDYRVTWEEQDSPGNSNLCDRVILHLYEKEEHLVVITVFISTGTILIQGKLFRNFGSIEFPALLDIINHMSDSDATESYSDAVPNTQTPIPRPWITAGKDKHGKTDDADRKGEENDDKIKEADVPDVNADTTENMENERPSEIPRTLDDVEPLVYTPSRLKSISTLRNSVATMESDFVSFQMEMTQCLQTIESTITTNDVELKDKIFQLQTNSKLHIKNLEDENKELQASSGKLTEEVSTLSLAVKRMQDQINLMSKKNSKLVDQEQILHRDYELLKIELEKLKQDQPEEYPESREVIISQSDTPVEENTSENTNVINTPNRTPTDIPLHNRFEVLSEETEQEEENAPEPMRTTKVTSDFTPKINKKAAAANVIILCDSNGKYLRLNKLCPNRQVTYYRCPTITRGNEIINSLPFDSPEMILIHTGTNDLERTNTADLLASKICNLIAATARKFPSSKIVYSTLLPRRDVPFEEITKMNSLIEKSCSRIANVHLIDHSNLNLSQQNILHDQKHLNQNGIKLFAKNLKDAIYGRRSRAPFSTEMRYRPPMDREIHLTPSRREPQRNRREPQRNSTTYAAVVQRPPPALITAPITQAPPPPTAATLLRSSTETQQHTDQEGTMSISIPAKMLPLIQFFNNLI